MMNLDEGFRFDLFVKEEYIIAARNVYHRLPKKIKRLIVKERFSIGHFHKNLIKSDPDEAAYFIHPNLIDINTEHLANKNLFLLSGTIAHEVGHGYFDHAKPIVKKILKWKFERLYNKMSEDLKKRYHYYSWLELCCDYLAGKWGFSKEIKQIRFS